MNTVKSYLTASLLSLILLPPLAVADKYSYNGSRKNQQSSTQVNSFTYTFNIGNGEQIPVERQPYAYRSYAGSKSAFRTFMTDDYFRQSYHDFQSHMLSSDLEKDLWKVIFSDPFLQSLYQAADKFSSTVMSESYLAHAITNYMKISPDLTPAYDRVDRAIVKVARDLGFSEKAIYNREVFQITGELNALTVSGNSQKIIVSVSASLIKSTSTAELESILAHELGHIRSRHTVLGMINGVLFGAIEAFVTGKDISPTLFSLQGFEDFGSVAAGLLSQSNENLAPILYNFLGTIVSNMPKEELSERSFKFWMNVLKQIKSPSLKKVSPEQFAFYADELQNAISRVQENTADLYPASIFPNELVASAFLKLMEVDFDHHNRNNILERLQIEADRYESFSQELRDRNRGSTHTATVLRTDRILNIEPLHTILMANPFLRLIGFKHFLRAKGDNLVAMKKQAQNTELKKVLTEEVEKNTKAVNALNNKIIALIKDIGLSAKNNPRLENLLQFYAVEQALELKSNDKGQRFETLADIIKLLNANLKKLSSGEEKTRIQSRLELAKKIQNAKNFDELQKLREEITNSSRSRIPINLNAFKAPICADIF